jgi:hypothetical protein
MPAVRNDLKLVSNALRGCGYEILTLPDEEVRNASILDKKLRNFCAECGEDDVHLIYFSGHGIVVENRDCIVPGGASLRDAVESPVQRVSTDLSAAVHANGRGLVVFIIDACRTNTADGWGDPGRLDVRKEHRFVRLFGCSSGELCHVLADGSVGEPVSVFARALADVLSTYQATSLLGVRKAVEEHCAELAKSRVIPLQTPSLSVGEISTATESLLTMPIFEASAKAAVPDLWAAFDPGKLHVLVIASERETKTRPSSTIGDLIREATTAESGTKIW